MHFPNYSDTIAQHFLGSLLSTPSLVLKYKNIPKGLLREPHDRKLFEAILALYEQYGNFDVETVAKKLGSTIKSIHTLEGVDECFQYVAMCHVACPNPEIHAVYADRLYQESIAYYIEKMSEQAKAKLLDGNVDDVMQDIEEKIQKLKKWKQTSILPSLGENFSSFYEKLCADHDAGGTQSIHFGYPQLDHTITSLNPGEVHVIGARPGVGKSMFALNIAHNVAKAGHHVLYFSLEMSEKQMMERLLGIAYKITSSSFAQKTDTLLKKISEQYDSLAQLPLSFSYRSGITPQDVEMTLNKEREVHPVDLIIIDHMHIMQAFGSKSGYEKMTTISNGLKIVAMNNQIPIIALAQLSRAAAKEEPTLTELRDSGSIEQDAETVAFLTRDLDPDCDPTFLKYLLRKNRNGNGFLNLGYKIDFDTYQIREL